MDKQCRNCKHFDPESGGKGYCTHEAMRVVTLSPCSLEDISSDLAIKVPLDFFCKYWATIPTVDNELTNDIAEIVQEFGYWDQFAEERNLIHENNVVDGILLNNHKIVAAFERFAQRYNRVRRAEPTEVEKVTGGGINI